jgi:hypothetical protein
MPASMQSWIVFDGHAAIGKGAVLATGSTVCCGCTSPMGECTGSTRRRQRRLRRGPSRSVRSAWRTGGGLVLAIEDGFALLTGLGNVEQVAVVEHPCGARKTESGLL